jgi:anti-anti-sigma factor
MDQVSSAQFEHADGMPRIAGELDLANSADLERFLNELGPQATAIDFSGVTFFDSTALRVLLRTLKDNPEIRIVNPSTRVARILEITQTEHLLHATSLQ